MLDRNIDRNIDDNPKSPIKLITERMLKRFERFVARPYRDTNGFLTVGYGWNLDSDPMFEEAASIQLIHKVRQIEKELDMATDLVGRVYRQVDDIRKEALIQMAFQMGVYGLGLFGNMLRAMLNSNWELAYREALDSKWAKTDSPKRAIILARMIRTGRWPERGDGPEGIMLLGSSFWA